MYDVYLCIEKLKNSQGFTCVKYASFEQANTMYTYLTDVRGVPTSNPHAMIAIPTIVPNYFVKPVLEYKLRKLFVSVGKIEDMWSSR